MMMISRPETIVKPANHQHQYHPDIHVQYVQPGEYLRIKLFDTTHAVILAISVHRPIHVGGYPEGGLFQTAVVLYLQLRTARLPPLPAVQAVHKIEVSQKEKLVILREIGLIDARNLQAADTDFVLNIIGVYLVAQLQPELRGKRLGDEHTVGRGGVAELGQLALQQVTVEKGRVELRSHSFQHHALKVFCRLYHSRLCGETLHMLHLRIGGQAGEQTVVHHHRTRLVGTCRIGIRKLDVRTESGHLATHLTLETHYDRHRDDHHCQPDSNAYAGYEHCRTGYLLLRLAGAIDAAGYETGKIHKEKPLIMF